MTNKLLSEHISYLDKVCKEYCISGLEVYTILITKDDTRFPLSYETIKYMVLKSISCEILIKLFTKDELKSILENTNMRKIKNPEMRKFISDY